MKKLTNLFLFVPALFLGISGVANSKIFELVSADGSDQASLCIAATVSKVELGKQLSALHMNDTELAQFSCNGLPIKVFADKYQQDQHVVSGGKQVVKVFAFPTKTKSTVAKLCVAAATSNTEFKKVLKAENIYTSQLGAVSCNNVPIKTFAKKNGNKRFRM